MIHYADWLQHWSARTPQAEALFEPDTGRRLTYAQLHERVIRLARALTAAGVKKGERVAVLAHNCGEQFELLFACMKLGAIFTPLNWRLSRFELAEIMKDADPRVLFHDSTCCELADALEAPRKVSFGAAYEDLVGAQSAAPLALEPVGLDEVAILLYTSGTTGRPKGAMLPVRQLIYNSHNTNLAVGLSNRDSTLVFLPLFHTGGLNCLATPIFHHGGRVVLMKRFDPERVCQLTEQERITAHMGVPTTFEGVAECAAFKTTDFSSVRFILVGGAPCPLGLIETYKARGLQFRQGFGMTEVGPNDFSLPETHVYAKMGSIGLPNFYLQARIVDENGNEVKPGEVGELQLSGPVVFNGYFRNEVATRAAFRGDWFCTGDLARRDEEGFHYIVDRKKDMFISGGENVYPAEVEQVILQRSEVAEVAVIGLHDARWGEVGRAVVVLRSGATLSEGDILAHCKERLAKYKVPKSVVFVPSLPRNASGKVLKPVLKEQWGR
ncbi:MAG: long-chain fatty acid--CoA ligase [Myxococcota bacterium]